MTITATCGHRIPDNSEEFSITRKGYTREDKRCLVHEMVCLKCKSMRRLYGDILETYEEQSAWLYSGDILDTEAEEQAWLGYEEE